MSRDQYEIEIRVRYQETDGMQRVHHANYLTYFEIARTEMLRAQGGGYLECESQGFFLVVAEVECRYLAAAQYDDLLRIVIQLTKAHGATIEHTYEVFRGSTLLAKGRTVIACVDQQGKVRRLPQWLLGESVSPN